MSTTTQDLVNAIKVRVAAVLGGSYSEAPYQIDIERNSDGNQDNVYSVMHLGIIDSTTVTRSVTYDQEFQIQATSVWINAMMSDSEQMTASIALQDNVRDIYEDLVNTQCGLPGTCLIVRGLNMDEPEYDEDSKMVLITMTFVAKYRKLI